MMNVYGALRNKMRERLSVRWQGIPRREADREFREIIDGARRHAAEGDDAKLYEDVLRVAAEARIAAMVGRSVSGPLGREVEKLRCLLSGQESQPRLADLDAIYRRVEEQRTVYGQRLHTAAL